MQKLLVIVGPTAVGKTALSVELAKKLDGEIISGDSMQVYRQLDIGTAKVTEVEKKGIPHHLIDCRNIEESYSAADFQKEARKKIVEIAEQGKLPIIVGGTGLYIQALVYDFQLGGKEELQSAVIREKYEAYAKENGHHALWLLLNDKDPLAASNIHENNQRRVIRALEVFETTGESIYKEKEAPVPLYDYYLVGLETERSLLYERINARVELMLQQGLLKEAELLYQQPDAQACQGIGYKEFFPFFANEQSLEEAVEEVKKNSRRYAKRQLTWFKNRMNASWWNLVEHPEELPRLEKSVEQWLSK